MSGILSCDGLFLFQLAREIDLLDLENLKR